MTPVSFGMLCMLTVQLGISTAADGQEPPPPASNSRALAATIDYGNDNVFYPIKSNTAFQCLGLSPGQLLTITVKFPLELASQPMTVEPLDGGLLAFPDGGFFVDGEGNVIFQFQAIDLTGLCRIAVHQPGEANFIQLWVVDPDHPENTPPDLAGLY